MKRSIINPWTWQEALGFVHGNKVEQPQAILFLSGQTASDEHGHCHHHDDLPAQVDLILENIGQILRDGGMDFSNVVRLNVYAVDMDLMMANHEHMVTRLKELGCRHTGTLLGVTGLASPGALVEMEATAVA